MVKNIWICYGYPFWTDFVGYVCVYGFPPLPCWPGNIVLEVIQMSPGHGAFRVETIGQRRLPLGDGESNLLSCAIA